MGQLHSNKQSKSFNPKSFNHSFSFHDSRLPINGKKDFNTAKLYFDRLNQDGSHFVNTNDICTPMDCVKEMVDRLPASFWKKTDLKILDSCCGNGNFHGYISTKVPLRNLYFNEINEKRIRNLKKYFGVDINLTIKDFMEYDATKQYDLVVSNPPYAKFNEQGRTSKNHNLARAFIKKALDITIEGGYILFIVPNNWMSFADRNILPNELSRYQFIHIDIHGAKKWFPKVGSSFTWFLLRKQTNRRAFTVTNRYVMNDYQKVTLAPGQKFIPLYLSSQVMDILNKTVNHQDIPKYRIETSSDLHKTTKKEFLQASRNSRYCHKIIHTPTQTIWSRKPHKYQQGWKVFLSLTNQYGTEIDNCGMTQSVAFIRCESKEEASRVKGELNNPVYKFINNITRYGNFNNIRVLQNLPIWGSFNLTSTEMQLIENFNSKYYGQLQS